MEDRGAQRRVGAGAQRVGEVSSVPAPPEAMTGTGTACATALVSARS
jgi:hypothetical protein